MTAEVPSVRLLLKHGAKPDLKDNDGCDALTVSRWVVRMCVYVFGYTWCFYEEGGRTGAGVG